MHWAPGIPCALCLSRGIVWQSSGASRRGNAQMCHERKRAQHSHLSSSGLTGRPSIPQALMMELRGRGVLDRPVKPDDDSSLRRSDLSAVAQRATASAEARRAKAEGGRRKRRSNPFFLCAARWIASLRLAMTVSRCATPHRCRRPRRRAIQYSSCLKTESETARRFRRFFTLRWRGRVGSHRAKQDARRGGVMHQLGHRSKRKTVTPPRRSFHSRRPRERASLVSTPPGEGEGDH